MYLIVSTSAVFVIICKVQGCRVRRSCHYAIEGQPRHLVEDGGDCKRRASNSVLGILFSEFTNPCPVGMRLPSVLKVATCVNCSVHEYVCTSISSGVTFPSFCPITAAGFQNRCVWRSQENTMMHIEKASKNVLVGSRR